jgi:hypothetical protein
MRLSRIALQILLDLLLMLVILGLVSLVASILFILLSIWFIGWKMPEFPLSMFGFTSFLLGVTVLPIGSIFPIVPKQGEKRIFLPLKGMTELQTDLAQRGVSYIQSSSSIYVPSTKVKYLVQASCHYWQGLDGRGYLMSPGEIARTELTREFGKPKIWLKKSDFEKLDFPVPQYWNGEQYTGYLWYVDLNAAYHQIYQELSLDVVWPRGLGSLMLKPVADRVKGCKPARNAIVGCTRSRLIFMNTPEGVKRMYFENNFLNPALWRTIQSILHEIATTAIRGGCRYVATDGYLFDNAIDFCDFTAFLADNEISFKSEKGPGYIRGFADYKVGKKETKVINKHPKAIDKVIREERGTLEWWAKVKKDQSR